MDDANRTILVKQQQEKAMRFLAQADEMYNLHYWDLAANRYYYACFHAVQALFIMDSISGHTHSGMLTQFSLHYVKTGIIDMIIIKGMRDLHFGADAPKVSQEVIDYETGKPGFDLLETDYH